MNDQVNMQIGGIIFYFDADAYDKIREYLGSLHGFFFDHPERYAIIDEIERRMAEWLLLQISTSKQVISLTDVEHLVLEVGESDHLAKEFFHQYASQSTGDRPFVQYNPDQWFFPTLRGLYRDEKRKLIGGVCSGIAYLLKIDPLWIRLLFLASFLDIFFFFTFSSIVLGIYVIGWIAIPGSDELVEHVTVKKLYRDPERSRIAGVCSGLAAYFQVEPVAFQVFFVALTLASGLGVILYAVLWLITPEAKTAFEKQLMFQDPITLEVMENALRRTFQIPAFSPSPVVRVLMFPVYLFSYAARWIGKNINSFGHTSILLLRTVAGMLLTILSTATVFMIALLVIIFFNLSYLPDNMLFSGDQGDIPLAFLKDSISTVGIAFTASAISFPFVFLAITGLTILHGRRIVSSQLNWFLVGIWIICIIGTAITLPLFFADFRTNASDKKAAICQQEAPQTLEIVSTKTGNTQKFGRVNLSIKSHASPEIKVEQVFSSKGRTRQNALENTDAIAYFYLCEKGRLVLDTHFQLKKGMPYRLQTLDVIVWVPFGQVFQVDSGLVDLLEGQEKQPFAQQEDLPAASWAFNQEGILQCLNCE
jgi:phage shock protein PspC (stress-responsive transcriptional regulator)